MTDSGGGGHSSGIGMHKSEGGGSALLIPGFGARTPASGFDREFAARASPGGAAASERSRPVEFASVYAEGFAFVWRSMRRLGVAPEAVPDAVQDVFVVVHRRLESFDESSTLKTWLFGIVLRVARDYRRTARRKLQPLVGDEALARAESPTAGPFERAESARSRAPAS